MRDEIAEYVARFANAEGGVLVLGLEDDGTVTGHGYPEDAIVEMLRVPAARLQPPMAEGIRLAHDGDGKELLVFDVPNADAPVMVTGNGYPLRMGDQTVKAQEPQIRTLKFPGPRRELGEPKLVAKARRSRSGAHPEGEARGGALRVLRCGLPPAKEARRSSRERSRSSTRRGPPLREGATGAPERWRAPLPRDRDRAPPRERAQR